MAPPAMFVPFALNSLDNSSNVCSTQPIAPDGFHDQDPTPRANNEQWRFTPSLLDPNSFAYNSFINPATGLFTPNLSGPSTMLHPAGDLQSPSTALMQGLATPFGMSAAAEAMHGNGSIDMAAFQSMHGHMHGMQPFGAVPSQGFAPAAFVHQDTGYETMDNDASDADNKGPFVKMMPKPSTLSSSMPLPSAAEKFRFHSTLNAPTAMIKHADEIPITYLNKGQAYTLSVVDTGTRVPLVPGTKYRTFVRVSFEDGEQRAKPNVCWGLWKEGRGTSEAHQRGGKLQAVEYVEGNQPAEGDDKRSRIEVESSSFDGFCVTWTPGMSGAPEVNINVRFNFLSTDFSHSKGVKGIPVRLCAKTSLVSADSNDTMPEICFCKVKLFRDHGAERKLSNDVAHVKKSIEKLKQQIAQAESGLKDTKRKRQSMASNKSGVDVQKAGKATKHKRTWSMSSAGSAAPAKMSLEEDLQVRLQTMQDMFTSTRPVSILFLRGEDGDDADLYPVAMPELSPASREGAQWQARSNQSSVHSSLVSRSPSSLSLASQTSNHWQNFDSNNVTVVNKTDDAGTLSGWIETLGVDPSYRPPQDRAPKPIACFYILCNDKADADKRDYHRAVYLMARTLVEFNSQIASKWGLDATKIQRTIRVLTNGLEVEMDNDVIRELKEGQDMRMEIEDSASTKIEGSMDIDTEQDKTSGGVVLRLTF